MSGGNPDAPMADLLFWDILRSGALGTVEMQKKFVTGDILTAERVVWPRE
jgi:hypothetical protein